MPVEIKELIIRAIVPAEAGERVDSEEVAPMHISPDERDALIQECVRQVLRILQKQEER